MLKAMKSYWAFTGTGYRVVVFILIPILALLVTMGMMSVAVELIPIALILTFVSLWFVDPMSDHWFLGGIYGKNKGALEFMQSSNCFSKFMKNVVIVDIVRRVLLNLGMYLMICLIGLANGVGTGETSIDKAVGLEVNIYVVLSFIPLLSMFISQIEVLIGRHFAMWNQRYFVVTIGFVIAGLTMTGCINLGIEYVWIADGLLVVLFVLAAIGTVVYTNKKVRESYYDK